MTGRSDSPARDGNLTGTTRRVAVAGCAGMIGRRIVPPLHGRVAASRPLIARVGRAAVQVAVSRMGAVRELQRGLWHWEAPHPAWKPGEEWGEMVSSYAVDDGERLLLFDPLALPSELEELAAERETAIVLTCPWHARDARRLAARLGAPIHVPPADGGDPDPVPGQVFREGDTLPVGVEALRGMEANDLVLWVESPRAIVAGDSLVDRGNGLEIPADWVGAGLDQVRDSLRSLLDRSVEHVLATHGGPTDRAALERALA